MQFAQALRRIPTPRPVQHFGKLVYSVDTARIYACEPWYMADLPYSYRSGEEEMTQWLGMLEFS